MKMAEPYIIWKQYGESKMSRYLVIDWELQSLWFADDIKDFNDGGSCRYGDINDLIKDVKEVLKGKEEDGRLYE